MSKKRKQMNRRRQLAKTRKGSSSSRKSAKGPAPRAKQEEETTSMTDLWLAVGIVALIIAAFVALWYFAVARPRRNAEQPITVETATPVTEALEPEPEAAATPVLEEEKTMQWSSPPEMTIDPSKSYQALMSTEKGDVKIQLYADKAPVTVNNFVFLAREGYYDGVTFHRVLEGFMAQTGDPTGTGAGGPGYSFADEFDPTLRHDSEGVLSMANAGANTNGSQFFITYVATPHLNDRHSVFGKVIEGMDVVRSLTPRDPQTRPTFEGDRILGIEIIEQ